MDTKGANARERRGVAAIMVALIFPLLLGIAACVVDVSVVRLWRQEMQLAVDAGAHAGTAQLDGTADGMVRARELAVYVTGLNDVAGSPVIIEPNGSNDPAGDVVLGYWRDDVFYPSDADPSRVTVVRVAASRDDLHTFFAPAAFAQDRDFHTVGVSASSTVLGGGPANDECPIPIAIPDCALDITAGLCDLQTRLNPDNNDNSGWAAVGSARPSATYVRNAIGGVCPVESTIDGLVSLNNGAIAMASGEMANEIGRSFDTWDTEEWGPMPARQACSSVTPGDYGKVRIGLVTVFHDPTACVSTKYTGTDLDVVGYATAVVYDACGSGASSERSISVRMVCDLDRRSLGGGGYYGTVVPPRLLE